MFEKEAEEYARNKMGGKEFELITEDDVGKYKETQKDWQKGAEFGFNKALEEQGDKYECEKETFIAGYRAGKDKAEADLATVAYIQGAENMKKKTDKQLTEAKEILKDIISSYGSTEVSEAQMYLKMKRAEQFLKEVEK